MQCLRHYPDTKLHAESSAIQGCSDQFLYTGTTISLLLKRFPMVFLVILLGIYCLKAGRGRGGRKLKYETVG